MDTRSVYSMRRLCPLILGLRVNFCGFGHSMNERICYSQMSKFLLSFNRRAYAHGIRASMFLTR